MNHVQSICECVAVAASVVATASHHTADLRQKESQSNCTKTAIAAAAVFVSRRKIN